jgi:hypothetical protein
MTVNNLLLIEAARSAYAEEHGVSEYSVSVEQVYGEDGSLVRFCLSYLNGNRRSGTGKWIEVTK